jgi:cell division protein FtsZ
MVSEVVAGIRRVLMIMNEQPEAQAQAHSGRGAAIKIVGIGGGGQNAVNRMIADGVTGAEFIAVNTDQRALLMSNAPVRIRIGDRATRGLGAGANPEKGANAAEESLEELRATLRGAEMVFITCGMGGGTGTGAAPVVAKAAKQLGALTVGVVTRPFQFEGGPRGRNADIGIQQLRDIVDTLIVIPNDRLLEYMPKSATFKDSFRAVDGVLRAGVEGISNLITQPGMINLDFADVSTVMRGGGIALLSGGLGKGEGRARAAAEQAIASPLLDVSLEGAQRVLLNITGGPDTALHEVSEVAMTIREVAHPDCNMIFGMTIDPNLKDALRVTLVATGMPYHPGGIPIELPPREPGRGQRSFRMGEGGAWWDKN